MQTGSEADGGLLDVLCSLLEKFACFQVVCFLALKMNVPVVDGGDHAWHLRV
jgi:hypothetical protein